MRAVSDEYKRIVANPTHHFEYKIQIGHPYPKSYDETFIEGWEDYYYKAVLTEYSNAEIVSVRVYGSLYTENVPTIGRANSQQIDVLLQSDFRSFTDIPRNARLVLWVAAVEEGYDLSGLSGETYKYEHYRAMSEWIQKGCFYVDTREVDDRAGTIRLHGYDLMAALDSVDLTEMDAEPQNLDFWGVYSTCSEFADPIITMFGGKDTRTGELDHTFLLQAPPGRSSARQIMQWIAAMHGANWMITDLGKWYLCPLASAVEPTALGMVDQVSTVEAYLSIGGVLIGVQDAFGTARAHTDYGEDAEDFYATEPLAPITRVKLNVDSDIFAVYGDETGYTLEADCYFAEQSEWVAQTVLSKMQGYVHQPARAENVIIDPALELGDVVTIKDKTFQVATWDIDYGRMITATLESPGYQENEFPKSVEDTQKALRESKDYADREIAKLPKVELVAVLPEDHASQNILFVIPDEG